MWLATTTGYPMSRRRRQFGVSCSVPVGYPERISASVSIVHACGFTHFAGGLPWAQAIGIAFSAAVDRAPELARQDQQRIPLCPDCAQGRIPSRPLITIR